MSRSRLPERGQDRLLFAVVVVAVGLFLWLAPRHRASSSDDAWRDIQSSIVRRFPEVRNVKTNEVAAWLADPARIKPLIIDVRAREEFDVSHLPGAVHAERVAEN